MPHKDAHSVVSAPQPTVPLVQNNNNTSASLLVAYKTEKYKDKEQKKLEKLDIKMKRKNMKHEEKLEKKKQKLTNSNVQPELILQYEKNKSASKLSDYETKKKAKIENKIAKKQDKVSRKAEKMNKKSQQ
jgi:hypothetical protein